MKIYSIQGPWDPDRRFSLKELIEEVDLSEEEVDTVAELRPMCSIDLDINTPNSINIRRVQ